MYITFFDKFQGNFFQTNQSQVHTQLWNHYTTNQQISSQFELPDQVFSQALQCQYA
jgi:hypothetical protein